MLGAALSTDPDAGFVPLLFPNGEGFAINSAVHNDRWKQYLGSIIYCFVLRTLFVRNEAYDDAHDPTPQNFPVRPKRKDHLGLLGRIDEYATVSPLHKPGLPPLPRGLDGRAFRRLREFSLPDDAPVFFNNPKISERARAVLAGSVRFGDRLKHMYGGKGLCACGSPDSAAHTFHHCPHHAALRAPYMDHVNTFITSSPRTCRPM